MNRYITIILLLVSVLSSCEKYDNDPSKRGYTPEAVDDNSWTANVMYEDSIITGLNPKDSVFIGTPVYDFHNHYKGLIMKTEGNSILSKQNQSLLVRAVDKNHVNIAFKQFEMKGQLQSAEDIVLYNIPIETGNDDRITFKSADLSLQGSLKGAELRISFLKDNMSFSYFSVEAYQTDYPQVLNGDFENWSHFGDNLPNCWNSLQTSQGTYSSFYYVPANPQVERSTEICPGSVGRYSCIIWTNHILELVIPGQLTTGCMNINSMVANKTTNFVQTLRTSSYSNGKSVVPYSQPFEAHPDSISFWVKYIAQDFKTYNAEGQVITIPPSASFSAYIHDDFDYKVYTDASYVDEGMSSHLVAKASTTIATKDGVWQRISLPFEYTSNTNAKYIIINVLTSSIPGLGNIEDKLFVDDIEMIYNKL